MSESENKSPNTEVILQPQEVVETTPSVSLGKQKPREVAYVVRDRYFDNLEVLKSDNAWWMDVTKLPELANMIKGGHDLIRALDYIGISHAQYYYFLKLHPKFSDVKARCEEYRKVAIENGLNTHIKDETASVLMWAAEKLMPEKYGKHVGEMAPTGGNNYGTVNNIIVPDSALSANILEKLKAREQSDAN